MAVEPDRFLIAASALWAGDFNKFRELTRDAAYEVATLQRQAKGPVAIIEATAALRLRQLYQKRHEFKILAISQGVDGQNLTNQPLILTTENLRAAVWRTGAREFLLQGYLSNLDYEGKLFKMVRKYRDESDITQPYQTEGRSVGKDEREGSLPLGGAWILPGNPFIQVEVSDMGLIEATAIWTASTMPETADDLTLRLQKLLFLLDPPLRHTTKRTKDE